MIKRKNIKKSGSKGFTLIELMFGIALLLVVIIAALLSYVNCAFLSESNRNLVIAANDAQYALEQIKVQQFNNISGYIAGYSSTKFTNLSNEMITFPNPVYTSTLDTITTKITWNERQATKTFSLTTCFAQ